MNKKSLLIVATVVAIVFLSLVLFGCADMGDFSSVVVIDGQSVENYDEYYALFDGRSASLIAQDKSAVEYDIEESLFNTHIVDELTPEYPEYEIPQKGYLYFAVRLSESMTIDEFALYFLSDDDFSLDIYAYVLSDDEYTLAISKIRSYDDPMYEQKEDEHGTLLFEDAEKTKPIYDTTKKIAYTDPREENAVCHSAVNIKTDESVYYQTFTVDGKEEEQIRVNKGDWFVLYFRSNSGKGKDENYPLTTFGITNMLFCVRDIGEE